MPRISSTLEVLDYQTKRWLELEYHRILVHHRKILCSHNDALQIEVPKFLCASCFGAKVDGVFLIYRGPDVLSESWAEDLHFILDDDFADSIVQDDDGPRCQSCRCNLHGCDLYVETIDLADQLGVPDETDTINPSRSLWNEVMWLYGRKCFACGSSEDLGADHIEPKSEGGQARFWNIQPLCDGCGNAKANRRPSHVVLVFNPWTD